VIDTPGFGDTRGINHDKEIQKQFHDLLKDMEHLDAVALVTQASAVRLTAVQSYIYTSVLELFGKDIAENIFIMSTFSDAAPPKFIDAFNVAGIPYKEIFKFNMSALYSQDTDDPVTQAYWKMGMSSFEKFFDTLSSSTSTPSLKLTKIVLEQRQQLSDLAVVLRPQIDKGFSEMKRFEEIMRQIEQNKDLANANKDFDIKQKVPVAQKVQLPTGKHTTWCSICNNTCHKFCSRRNDADKKRCSSMDKDGNCKVCPKKCHWSSHSNNSHYVVWKTEEKETRAKELYKKYISANSQKSQLEQVMAGLKGDHAETKTLVSTLIKDMADALNKLSETALSPSKFNMPDYFQMMIDSETKEKNAGWEDRVEQIKNFQNDTELIVKIEKGWLPFQ